MSFTPFARFFTGLLIVAVLLCARGADAQDNITVRSGVHPAYSRLVFDWPNTPDYKVTQTGTTLTITFSKGAKADISAVTQRDLPNIKNVKVVSTDPLTLTVDIPATGRVRHFAAAGRMMLDVYPGDGEEKALAAVKDTPPVKPAAKEPVAVPKKPAPEKVNDAKTKAEVPAAAKPEPVDTAKTDSEAKTKPAETPAPPASPAVAAAPVRDVEQQPLAQMDVKKTPALSQTHIVMLTATTAQGMAVFTRGNWLWLVSDDPSLPNRPQISGPQSHLFGEPERLDISGGVAFRLRLPEGSRVETKGSGLLWRVFVGPRLKPSPSIDVIRRETPSPALFWPLVGARRVLSVVDPVYGDTIKAVTVENASQHTGTPADFVSVRTLPSAAGMALLPKADDVIVVARTEGVAVSRPRDMVFSGPADIRSVNAPADTEVAVPPPPPTTGAPDQPPPLQEAADAKDSLSRVYHFDRWEMGGWRALDENRRVLMTAAAPKKPDVRAEDLMTLAKLHLANNRGPEALGYLRVVQMQLPEMEDNAEFSALRGAAAMLAGRPDEAIEDFAKDSLKDVGELGYWRAATLGALEDWAQAITLLPGTFDVLASYPPQIRLPVGLMLAEVALRGGKPDIAEKLLGLLDKAREDMTSSNQAAWQYLMGETQRQKGNKDKAIEVWTPLIAGADDYYRAKAGLSLTRLQQETNKITVDQAIDRLEGLRYAWRGDELETLINYRLGQVYIENGDTAKGLSVLRNASTLYPDSAMGKEVTAYMTKTFRDAFMNDGAEKLKPLEAVTIYDEFGDLVPAGEEGNKFVERMVDRLAESDLLGRASTLLESLVTQRLQGDEKAQMALKLAAIRLLDGKPEGALRAIDVAEETWKLDAAGLTEDRNRELRLLRARALSKMNKVDEAFTVLDDLKADPVLTRLKVDTAWAAGRWDEAARALDDLIMDEDISLTRPLTAYQTDLILKRAIALNLDGDRVALGTMRERYGDAMKQTDKSQLFDVVTRQRQLGMIGTRENVGSLMSEVDMFKDFLDSYRKSKTP